MNELDGDAHVLFYPVSFKETSLETRLGIKAEDIWQYTYPPGHPERYTDAGWLKWLILNGQID